MSTAPTTARPTEQVTHSVVRDVDLPGLGTLALITLDNAAGPRRPNTLGPAGVAELRATLQTLRGRARAGELVAVAITGKAGHFAAGADLRGAAAITTRAQAREVAEGGHTALRLLGELDVPTFAFVSGAALGGGLEVALHCDHRTVGSDVRALGLPETLLGLVPGWGGAYLLPRLIGPSPALEVIIDNPLRNNATLTAGTAAELGIVDAVLGSEGFLDASLAWTSAVLRGEIVVERRPLAEQEEWDAAVERARTRVESRLAGAAPAFERAIDLVAAARERGRDEAFAAEDDALTELLLSPQFRAGAYAFELTTSRAKRPAGAPSPEHARPVATVGIVGAGLMASQLALLFTQRLRTRVVMRDLDDDRAERGRGFVADELSALAARGRISPEVATQALERVTATSKLADLADCDLVIEAVFEELEVKRAVFAEAEEVLSPTAILATNTSALSVTAMSDRLAHPERVVGLHFFNPVAQMPLVEVVRTSSTSDEAAATAFAIAAGCGKSAIAVHDAPGFVVNRLLVRLLGEVLGALEEGTPVAVADRALGPMGLPMGPFQLLQLVGPAVAEHVLLTLRAQLGERYPASPGLRAMVVSGARFVEFEQRPTASSPVDPAIAGYFGGDEASEGSVTVDHPGAEAALLRRVEDALAVEARAMLDEGVVSDAADIDLAMILGAGWPFWLGGITPYLDRCGAAERVAGGRFSASARESGRP